MSGLGWTGTSKIWELREAGRGGERFTLWSPSWSLARLLVALQARTVCQYLCTVTHLMESLNTEAELMLLWAAQTNPSFVCSFYLDSERRKWHFSWLFHGVSYCKHCCCGGGGRHGALDSQCCERCSEVASLLRALTVHLSLGNKANSSALLVSGKRGMYAKSLTLLKCIS